MPVGIKTPMNQIKLTNVTTVRLRKGKLKYEVACYNNKIQDWKNGIETNLDNVIQIPGIYLDVDKGKRASNADLAKGWGEETDKKKMIIDILRDGQYQVGEKERAADLERIKNEVVNIVASKLVEPESKRPYTTGMIEKTLDQLSSLSSAPQGDKASGDKTDNAEEKEKPLPKWRGVVATKDAKTQANHAIKCLMAHQHIPVARIQMRLRITCPVAITKHNVKAAARPETAKGAADDEQQAPKNVKDTILSLLEKVESEDTADADWVAVGLVEPGNYKVLNDFIENQSKGRGRVEVLDQSVGVDV